ncbi:MAG: hypothetical protein ACE5HJ_08415 [Thermoplasmata archaeon]
MILYWIERERLAGGSCPTPDELRRMKREGFDAIISLLDDMEQCAYSPEEAGSLLRWYNVPLRDHATPALGQLVEFYDILWALPRSYRVFFHCFAGIGRTGTVAASYLVLKGQEVDEAFNQVDGWTGGYFMAEISQRKDEVRRLMVRLRQLFLDESPTP